MVTTMYPEPLSPPPSPALGRRVRSATFDALVLSRRDFAVWARNPALLAFSIIQPVMFVLLFRYVFGGAIPVHVHGGYVDYLMPGIVAQAAAFASFGTAIALAHQSQQGIIDRFRSMPIARSAVLLGRLMADLVRLTITVLLLLGVGYAVGFRLENGPVPGILMVVLAMGFGLAIGTVSAFIGLAIRNVEAVGTFGLIWLFPLTFVSSAFVPVTAMPGWLRGFATNQPVTVVVEEMRSLALGGPLALHAWQSAVWIVALTAVFVPAAVWAYRRSTSS